MDREGAGNHSVSGDEAASAMVNEGGGNPATGSAGPASTTAHALRPRDRLTSIERAAIEVVAGRSRASHGVDSCRRSEGARGDRGAAQRRSDGGPARRARQASDERV